MFFGVLNVLALESNGLRDQIAFQAVQRNGLDGHESRLLSRSCTIVSLKVRLEATLEAAASRER